MAWPLNPNIGDTYTAANGNVYIYTSTGTWQNRGNQNGFDAGSITGTLDEAQLPVGVRQTLASVTADSPMKTGRYYLPYTTGVAPNPPVPGAWYLTHLEKEDSVDEAYQIAYPELESYGHAWHRFVLNGVGGTWQKLYRTASEIDAYLSAAFAAKVSVSSIGAANGIASLDGTGKVPASQLPSFVDDVLEYTNVAAFPATGDQGKLYVDLATSRVYRWSGSVYVEIVPQPGSTDAVSEGATNKYFTEARVRASVLTGISTASASAVVASDSILVALGKLQAQANLIANKADLASPTFTGTPAAPTATAGTNTTQVATTAFVTTAVAAKASTSHTHAISDVTNLQSTLDSKLGLSGGTMTGELNLLASTTALTPLNIPHGVAPTSPTNGDMWTTTSGLFLHVNGVTRTQWDNANLTNLTQTEAEAGSATTDRIWSALRVRQAIIAAPVGTATQTALNAKAASVHTHAISDTTGLQTALDGKAAASHTHAIADVTNLQSTLDGKAGTASPTFTGVPVAPTALAGTSTTQLATTEFVTTAVSGKANTSHSHAIADTTGLQTALDAKAPLASPSLSGTPTAPTATAGTNTTQVATTAFVTTAVATKANASHTHAISDVTNLQSSLDAKAPLASPTFTGTPAAPTATAGTSTTQVATTAFVTTALASKANATHTHAIADTTGLQTALDAKANTSHTHAIADVTNLQTTLDGKVPLTGGTMTGKLLLPAAATGAASITLPHGTTPTTLVNGDLWSTTSGLYARINGGTRTIYDSSTLATISQSEAETGTATTARAYTAQRVAQQIAAAPVGTATTAALALKADLASPALTGTPTAPTATTSDTSTQIATTAFVKAAIQASGGNAIAQASAPASPLIGDLWFNTSDEILYIYTPVGGGTTVWLDISSASGGTVPSGGAGEVHRSAVAVDLTGVSGALFNNIPANTYRFRVDFMGLQTGGNNGYPHIVRVGGASGLVTTGYAGSLKTDGSGLAETTGAVWGWAEEAGPLVNGHIQFHRLPGTHIWKWDGVSVHTTANYSTSGVCGGYVTMTEELTQFKVMLTSGTTFVSGKVFAEWEV